MLAAATPPTDRRPLFAPPDQRWRVGFSVNTSMARALSELRRTYGDQNIYYPMVRELRPIPKRKLPSNLRDSPFAPLESVIFPLWPRYFFVKLSLVDGTWFEVFKDAQVRGIVCDADGTRQPAEVLDCDIDGLRAQEIDGAIPSKATIKRISYNVGEEVRITTGPLQGHNGTVERMPDIPIEQLDETAKLRLLVGLFGKSVIELSIMDIEKL